MHYCLKCERPMTRYIPIDKDQPDVWLCTNCGAIMLPQINTGKWKAFQITEVPQSVAHVLEV